MVSTNSIVLSLLPLYKDNTSVRHTQIKNQSPTFLRGTDRHDVMEYNSVFFFRLHYFCDPFGARTQDPSIKSAVLYLLS